MLLKDFFGLPEDLNVWFVYAPPLDSPYLDNWDGVLDCLEKHFGQYDSPIIMGDLNGKTKTAPDYVLDATHKHSPINDIDQYITDTPVPRRSMDEKSPDTQGRRILELCQSNGLRILNGRTAGDRWGLLTRYPLSSRESPSLLDYAISSTTHTKRIESFQVYSISDLSDHFCISCKLTTNEQQQREAEGLVSKSEEPKRPRFQLDLALQYAENLKKQEGFQELRKNLEEVERNTQPNQDQVDGLIGLFNSSIIDTAIKTFPSKAVPKTKKKVKQHKPAKWFNDECSKTRKAHRRALAKLNKKPFDNHLRELAIHARKVYKTACKQAESKLRDEVARRLLELSGSDPKEFWKTLKNMREWGRKPPDPSDGIQPHTWQRYYTELLNKQTTKQFTPIPGESDPLLDHPLKLEELKEAIAIAKRGKACGPDIVQIEYIKHATEDVVKLLFRIMKILFKTAMFPQQWTVNFLRPIYKKECKDDPNNYRGLAIASTISKLFSLILLQRLETYMVNNKIISPNQIGFCKGY